jgi:hypothetical protein
LVLPLLQCPIELEHRNVFAVDLRGELRAPRDEIVADAPENERQGDQAEDDDDDPSAEGVVNFLQHRARPEKQRTDLSPGAR